MISLDSNLTVEKYKIISNNNLPIEFSFPIIDIQEYWMPELRLPSQKLFWRISCKSSGVCNFPFISFFNTNNINRISIMVDTLDDDCEIFCRMNQKVGVYEVIISIKPKEECTLIIDKREINWQTILADFRANLGIPKPYIPKAAWEPVYCTWYAAHTALSEEFLEETCTIASKLGFKTLIVDDGWSFDKIKRHCPELIDTWYEDIGDWQVSFHKFPNFKEHVKKIQGMGLKYMLWIAPPIIGEKSSMNEVLLTCDLDKERIDGSHRLLPYRKEALELMANKFSSLIKEYDIDGLKIDYLDFFRPDTKEPKGRLMRAFAKLISEKIRSVKEDALIEYRQFYTVPGMLNYATQYRAGDVPYDWMDNFNRLAQMRITLGDNLPLHADPAFWRCDETIENVGRHMIATLAGVPMVSIDFNQIPKAHIKVIANYLNLYREFLTVFQKGHWQVNYYLSNTSSLTVEYKNVKIAFINDSCRVPKNATVYFNLCNETLFLDGVDSFDQLGNRVACIPVGGYGKVI